MGIQGIDTSAPTMHLHNVETELVDLGTQFLKAAENRFNPQQQLLGQTLLNVSKMAGGTTQALSNDLQRNSSTIGH